MFRILVPPANVCTRMALDGAGRVTTSVQHDVAQFMDDGSGFLAEDHRVSWFSQIFPNRFRV